MSILRKTIAHKRHDINSINIAVLIKNHRAANKRCFQNKIILNCTRA